MLTLLSCILTNYDFVSLINTSSLH